MRGRAAPPRASAGRRPPGGGGGRPATVAEAALRGLQAGPGAASLETLPSAAAADLSIAFGALGRDLCLKAAAATTIRALLICAIFTHPRIMEYRAKAVDDSLLGGGGGRE